MMNLTGESQPVKYIMLNAIILSMETTLETSFSILLQPWLSSRSYYHNDRDFMFVLLIYIIEVKAMNMSQIAGVNIG